MKYVGLKYVIEMIEICMIEICMIEICMIIGSAEALPILCVRYFR